MLQKQLKQQQYRKKPNLHLSLAHNPSETAEAQRLCYKIFAEEMGAELTTQDGLDVDGFDEFCDHLLIRDSRTQKVVGTYRL